MNKFGTSKALEQSFEMQEQTLQEGTKSEWKK
jgi:hypothetical protein